MKWATSDHASSPPSSSAADDRTRATLRGEELRALAEEQAALRRVATLVARGVPQEELFAAVTEEVGQLLPAEFAIMGRYEDDDTVMCVAAWGAAAGRFRVGSRSTLEGDNLVTIVLKTGSPSRVDHFAHASGPIGVLGRQSGFHSAVGTPIVVEGRPWGVMTVGSTLTKPPLPADTEARLASFTELVATAVANAESRAEVARLAEEQAALRRVATLVARGIPQAELFAAVTEEAGRVLRVDAAAMARYESDETMTSIAIWSRIGDALAAIGSRHQLGGQNVSTLVFQTGRPARIDAYAADTSGSIADEIRTVGVRSAVGAPISVEGRLWGVIHAASTREQPLPADTETRLVSFTELVATAIANAESRAGQARLAHEQAALRRVATLAASGIAPDELFAAVSEEVGELLGAHLTGMARYNSDETVTVLATWAAEGEHPLVPGPWPLDGGDLASEVWRTGQPVRIADYQAVRGRIAAFVRNDLGIGSSVGSPVVVGGRLWGVLFVHGRQNHPPFPLDIESRLTSFAELVATAIANAESHAGLARLAEEQAALRRVATLVASGSTPEDVFAAATEEVGRLLPVDFADLSRYESDGAITMLATWGITHAVLPSGARLRLGGKNLSTVVAETGASARIESYEDASGPIGAAVRKAGVRSVVGTPIIVDGRLWGMVAAGSRMDKPLPEDVEARLASFTELLATAIANAESRAGLARLADEQAALRRVATLVARGVPSQELFAAVAEEVVRLLPVDFAHMGRYEADGTVTVVGASGSTAEDFHVGSRWNLGGQNLTTMVFETGRSARLDRYSDAFGALGDTGRQLGIRSSVGTPIIVEDHVWGVVTAGSTAEESLPTDLESRLENFTELVATAIANAESRAEVTASRARIVAAADESRRRIERDLHDGAQQRLVHAVIALKLALQALSNGDANADELVAEALRHAEQASVELRELAHGILPAALTRGGLRAGIDGLVSRVSLPVSVDVCRERLPAAVEATAYFIVSEALTNVVKHARAGRAEVSARLEHGRLRVEIRDDGVGGARGGEGTGLGGLADRVSALDGRFELESPPGAGTRLCAILPVSGQG